MKRGLEVADQKFTTFCTDVIVDDIFEKYIYSV